MIKIRPAGEKDFESVLKMIKGLAEFQNAGEKVKNTVELMQRDKAYFTCFVAEDSKHGIVGMAMCFIAYFTWVGKSIYLDDLYIREDFRGKKLGSSLLNEVFSLAREESCNRVRWQVSHWNSDAISFYKKCGAKLDHSELNCDFDADAIQKFQLQEVF